MVHLNVHPEAEQSFDKRADALVARLAPVPRRAQEPAYRPDTHVAASFSEAELENITTGSIDHSGRPVARAFAAADGQQIGLFGDAYKDFGILVEDLQSAKPIRAYVSKVTVARYLFDWIRARYLGSWEGSMCAQVLPALALEIRAFNVWIPVSDLYVDGEWRFGRSTFRPMTSRMFDDAELAVKARGLTSEAETGSWKPFERHRKRFQGRAAGVVSVEAEPDHARDVALASPDYSSRSLARLGRHGACQRL